MRPSNDEFFLGIAEAVSKRATCGRRQVGCILVDKNYQILATGYNSVACGVPHCPDEKDCGGSQQQSGNSSKCIARHSEDIALMKCADIYAIQTCYVTTAPCIDCVRRLLDTTCKRIVFSATYPGTEAKDLWLSRGLIWEQI